MTPDLVATAVAVVLLAVLVAGLTVEVVTAVRIDTAARRAASRRRHPAGSRVPRATRWSP